MIDGCHSSDSSKDTHFKTQFSQLSSAQRKRITNGLSWSSREGQTEEEAVKSRLPGPPTYVPGIVEHSCRGLCSTFSSPLSIDKWRCTHTTTHTLSYALSGCLAKSDASLSTVLRKRMWGTRVLGNQFL